MATLLVDSAPLDPRLLAPGAMIGGRYRVKDVVGRGGFGTVYQAMHVGTGRFLAVKVLHGGGELAAMRRFFFEARSMARLEDPASVQVLDFGQDDAGFVYLAMELLRGKTLREESRDRAALGIRYSEAETAAIALGVLRSLREAHRQGLIHRDLKPENVFLHLRSEGGAVVKVCDFGIAKRLGSAMTSGNQALGTPEYMSPEQAQLSGTIDGRSDLYALGVILFELLAGEVPYRGELPLQVMLAHAQSPIPRLVERSEKQVSSEMSALIERALSKRPEDRFADADAMTEAVLAIAPGAAGIGIALAPARASTRPTPGPAQALALPAPISLGTTLLMTPSPAAPPAARRWGLLVALAVAAGAGIAYRGPAEAPLPSPPTPISSPSPPESAMVAPPPVAPVEPPSASASVRLVVTPADARIEVDGAPVIEPLSIARARGSEHLVVVSAPGFLSWRRRLIWTEDQTINVRLEPIPKPKVLPFRSTR